MSAPLTPTATRALLDQLGHRPRRQLGQNFLVDGNIVRKSLELAAIGPGDRVVEVGPGLGTLTTALLDRGAIVYAVERDSTMVQHLRQVVEPAYPLRFLLLEGDAVETPLAGLPDDGQPFKIVANLPYAISSPWMEAVLAGPLPMRLVLMLQLEAAQRYVAAPGSKTFGAISGFLQAAYRVAPGHRVSRTCFHPIPDVDSTLLNLERSDHPYAFSAGGRELIRSIFQHRRKQLAPLVRKSAPEAAATSWLQALRESGLRDDIRAESVPVPAWVALDRLLQAAG